MKLRLIPIFILMFCASNNNLAHPLLVTVLMVKNEAAVIEKTLLPLVQAGLKDFVVLDTGSTDGTQELTRQLFKKYDISSGYLFEEPFVDFATSRNRALELTEKLFPHADFLYMIDAEWYTENVQGLVKFCEEKQKKQECLGYFLRLVSPVQEFSVPRLIVGGKGVRFTGVVHEFFNTGSNAKVPADVYIRYAPSAAGKLSSEQRWIRDRDLLLKSLAQDPHNQRTMFYLAQTYACLHEWEHAQAYYKLRAETPGGCPEERYYAWYYLGLITQKLSQTNPKYTWQSAFMAFLEAYTLRPHRAEPLVRMANHFFVTGNMPLAYLFSRRAIELPYPDHDIGYIERDVYEFSRYDLLGASAIYVGEYDMGHWAIEQALQARPTQEHLYKNKALYEQVMKEKRA